MASELDPAIAAHYRHDPERNRLETWARLEGIRTRELLSRFLPAPPAVVLDIGGARGAYALPLAQEGYEVHLIDPYLPHVEAAKAASAEQPDAPIASVAIGDARELPFVDASADAVLLFGPLYHLPAADDRAHALVEARRVLRSGGVLLAAGISCFASTFDGVRLGLIADPTFEGIVEGTCLTGCTGTQIRMAALSGSRSLIFTDQTNYAASSARPAWLTYRSWPLRGLALFRTSRLCWTTRHRKPPC